MWVWHNIVSWFGYGGLFVCGCSAWIWYWFWVWWICDLDVLRLDFVIVGGFAVGVALGLVVVDSWFLWWDLFVLWFRALGWCWAGRFEFGLRFWDCDVLGCLGWWLFVIELASA